MTLNPPTAFTFVPSIEIDSFDLTLVDDVDRKLRTDMNHVFCKDHLILP